MASNRIMQAIATLERAVSRFEQDVEDFISSASEPSPPPVDHAAARAALQSLDDLITELKGAGLKEDAHG